MRLCGSGTIDVVIPYFTINESRCPEEVLRNPLESVENAGENGMNWRDLFLRKRQKCNMPEIGMGATTFLEQAILNSIDGTAELIAQNVNRVGARDTGRLKASISFGPAHLGSTGTMHYYPTPTGTVGARLAYAMEPPIWGTRSYITAWPCSWCDRLNTQQSMVCVDCGGNRGVVVARHIPRDWQCPWCRQTNGENPFKCDKCGSKRIL